MAVTIDGTTGITTPGVTDTGNLSVAGTTSLTTPLPVTSGGTGSTTTPPAGSVVYGDGTGYAYLSAGLSNQMLISNGSSAPSWRNQFIAGTATVPPIQLVSGTNMTSPSAGSIEYDGTTFYGTPIVSQRGIIPGAQFFRLNSDLVGANGTSAQNIFGVGVTLAANTVYAFEALYILTKTAGVTSHTVGLGFGGTVGVNNVLYFADGSVRSGALPGQVSNTIYGLVSNSFTNTTTTAAITSAALSLPYIIRGTISTSTSGTMIPQYTLSAAPGGAYSTTAGSYFMIYPIGAAGSNTSVGTWA